MVYKSMLKQYLIYKGHNIKGIKITGDKYLREIEIELSDYDDFDSDKLKNDIGTYLKEWYEYYDFTKPEILLKII